MPDSQPILLDSQIKLSYLNQKRAQSTAIFTNGSSALVSIRITSSIPAYCVVKVVLVRLLLEFASYFAGVGESSCFELRKH